MRDRYQDIRQAGGDVLVISFTPPPFLALYLRDHPLPFPLLSDPPRSAYHAFGLERTTWRTLLRPGIAARADGFQPPVCRWRTAGAAGYVSRLPFT